MGLQRLLVGRKQDDIVGLARIDDIGIMEIAVHLF